MMLKIQLKKFIKKLKSFFIIHELKTANKNCITSKNFLNSLNIKNNFLNIFSELKISS